MLAKAAVLCGGEGNRLRPFTSYFHKTMIPVAARRRPIREYPSCTFVQRSIIDRTRRRRRTGKPYQLPGRIFVI
jgi:hypothetical protein